MGTGLVINKEIKMKDSTKKALNIGSAIGIAAGVIGYVLTGGTEADAINIVSVSVAGVAGLAAIIGAIKK